MNNKLNEITISEQIKVTGFALSGQIWKLLMEYGWFLLPESMVEWSCELEARGSPMVSIGRSLEHQPGGEIRGVFSWWCLTELLVAASKKGKWGSGGSVHQEQWGRRTTRVHLVASSKAHCGAVRERGGVFWFAGASPDFGVVAAGKEKLILGEEKIYF